MSKLYLSRCCECKQTKTISEMADSVCCKKCWDKTEELLAAKRALRKS